MLSRLVDFARFSTRSSPAINPLPTWAPAGDNDPPRAGTAVPPATFLHSGLECIQKMSSRPKSPSGAPSPGPAPAQARPARYLPQRVEPGPTVLRTPLRKHHRTGSRAGAGSYPGRIDHVCCSTRPRHRRRDRQARDPGHPKVASGARVFYWAPRRALDLRPEGPAPGLKLPGGAPGRFGRPSRRATTRQSQDNSSTKL
jgi:hypothetical protein